MLDNQISNEGLIATRKAIAEKPLAIKCGEIFTITTPDGLVTDTGIRELQDFLAVNGLGNLPADFEPCWATKRGTLPKRLASHLYKSLQVKLTTSQVSDIGNIAKRNTSSAQTYYCDFTRSIDWKAGDFGDSGSCYWQSNSGAKTMIEENGYAVRFYCKRNSEAGEGRGNLRGIARAWIAPIDDNKLVVFNSYGFGDNITIPRVLSVLFSCGYKRIRLTNNGHDSGLLYVNGGSAFGPGAWSKIQETLSHDLQWEDTEAECQNCYVCGNDVDDDDAITAYDRYGDTRTCCEDCTFACHNCDETYTEDCEHRLDGESYCRTCRDEVLRGRAEQIERLNKKIADLEIIREDLQGQIDETVSQIDDAKSEIDDLGGEVE